MLPPIGRIGFAGANVSLKRDVKARACNLAAGDLYTYPTSNSTVDATQPVVFKWNTACPVTSPNIDLYLYESSAGLIHAWQGLAFSSGQYSATLLPKWWNDTTTASLQLSIIDSGAASWDTSSPVGPVFTANYAASAMFSTASKDGSLQTSTAAAAATQSVDAVFQQVSSNQTHKGPSKGVIAAAVLVPLILLAGVAVVAMRFWRTHEQEKRRRWSAALSTHSNLDWEKGAHAGEKPGSTLGRPSLQHARPSTHHSARTMSFATSSVYAVENNMAGAGAGRAFRPHSTDNVSSVRSSFVTPDGQVRQSRISFADVPRPDRHSRLSLAGDLRPVIPNLGGANGIYRLSAATKSAVELSTPNRKNVNGHDEEDDINISPSQLQGPDAFADAEMRRVANKQRTGRRSIMSLGGDKSKRESTASALSSDDFKSAASARGSVNELRDLEAVMLMRRSIASQHSTTSTNHELTGQVSNPLTPDPNAIEALDQHHPVPPASYDLPTAPSPIAGSSTVPYGPDQMLAVYAARGKVASSPAPIPGDMRSFVHLNRGTVSATVVDALPAPGPRGSSTLRIPMPIPMPRGRSNTMMSRASEGSSYSMHDDEIGNAK